MENILERLKSGVLVADGAMGTVLQQRGLSAGEAPEVWNLSHPETIEDVHRAYIQAGAEMIITNTFGGNRLKLKRSGLESKITEVNTKAVQIARRVAAGKVYLAGDIGPTGEFMQPLGEFPRNNFLQAFSEQARFLASAGVDLFIIETMTDIEELLCAVEAVGRVSPLPVIACMSFQPAGEGYRTMMGVSPADMAGRLASSACRIIGTNCGLIAKQMYRIISDLKQQTKTFLIAEPNAGHPRLEAGQTVFDQTPEDFARDSVELVRAGANIVGGCCGTTPEHIKKLCEAIRSLNPEQKNSSLRLS